jgi:O-methyltransferase involved in polyketide biosynthesis
MWAIFQTAEKISPEDMTRATRGTLMYPFMEARYLMTDHEIAKSGIAQVLELASGLSPRGIAMTASPAVTYVEMDLAGKLATKKMVIDRLIAQGTITARPNLYLEEGNVTNTADFENAAQRFADNKPIAVICEGLLRYISPEDRKTLATNIYNLLKKNGGIWTTPDLEFLDIIQSSPKEKERYDDRVKKFGYDIRLNIFKNEADAVAFFEGCGFHVTKHPLANLVDELTILARIGISKEEAAQALAHWFNFTMTVE